MESRLPRVRCDRTAAWAQLQAHAQKSAADFGDFDMRAAFASDTNRFTDFSLQAPHLFADLSKNRIDRTANDLLLALAGQCGVAAQRDAMFAGEAINGSENRAVMHFLLRKTAASHGIPAQAAIKSIAIRSSTNCKRWATPAADLLARRMVQRPDPVRAFAHIDLLHHFAAGHVNHREFA